MKDGGVHERRGAGEEQGAGQAHQEGLPAGEEDHQAAAPRHRQLNPHHTHTVPYCPRVLGFEYPDKTNAEPDSLKPN